MTQQFTKLDLLRLLPLYECQECGRLEHYLPQFGAPWCSDCDLAAIEKMTRIEKPTETQFFEAAAQHFYRETNTVAPGKSIPDVMDNEDYRALQKERWEKWLKLTDQQKRTLAKGLGITFKEGVLWVAGGVVTVLTADHFAYQFGFGCAEQLVEFLAQKAA